MSSWSHRGATRADLLFLNGRGSPLGRWLQFAPRQVLHWKCCCILPSHPNSTACMLMILWGIFLPQAKITCLEDITERFSASFEVIIPAKWRTVSLLHSSRKDQGSWVIRWQSFSAAIGSQGAGVFIHLQSKEEFATCLNQPYVCWLGVVTRRTPDKSRGAQPASLYQMGQCQSSLFLQGDSRSCSPLEDGGILAGSLWC